MIQVDRRLAVVTGASGGIGSAVCRLLRRDGWRVAGLARRESPAADVSLRVDVSDGASVDRAFAQTESPALVVHAAGVIEPVVHFAEADPEAWAGNVRVNLLGTFFVLRAAARRMLEAQGGRIVTVTSGAASRAKPWWSAYSVSKAGAEHLVRSAAVDLEGTTVSVCALDPGITETPMQERVRATKFPDRDRFVRVHREGRSRTPDKVAAAILRVAARPADQVNGRVVRIDEA
jgi:NAD(P)-dependent dehydrogenase (short-subunit alcohol dehydrogenase family)